MNYGKKRFYIRLTSDGRPIFGSVVERVHPPKGGRWADITDCLGLCCVPTTTTTTTTTSTTTIP